MFLSSPTSAVKHTYPGGRALICEAFRKKEVPDCAIDTMVESISASTMRQYETTYRQWWNFCSERSLSPYQAPSIIEFLQRVFEGNNLQYGSMNSHRSALALINLQPLSNDARLSRFMKGISRLRSSKPRYNSTWDPNVVLEYLQKLGPNFTLTLKDLSANLVTLLALATGHRLQTIQLIKLSNIHTSAQGIQIPITGPVKTSGSNRSQPCLQIPRFAENPLLCVATTLIDYIEATKPLQTPNQDYLFITFKEPYKTATKQSISRWIKNTLLTAGLDTNGFKPHSFRHASTSAAYRHGLSLSNTLSSPGS
ncbi:uncharacterized protein LOC116181252 [Photinus pyralis]|uniref:uncharacterized protein LOC116166315 n=1 Tax=Photinus pyralis TaxID=7054 RepID=UPI00126712D4|nr:uncharacterized protein LOC116166315 [Photinus pyralis]XP_031353265.1 uncharacterized protein LOC116178092 [Photinus pyralis]XP_031357418.1 uncharacterized protein LOC116181252 [Photinus pyralis]